MIYIKANGPFSLIPFAAVAIIDYKHLGKLLWMKYMEMFTLEVLTKVLFSMSARYPSRWLYFAKKGLLNDLKLKTS